VAKSRFPLIIFLIVLVLAVGRESQAVIYKFVNEKGIPTFADDMQKIPEQYRAEAVIVTGGNDYDAYTEQEKARLAAERSWPEQRSATPVKAEQPLSARLIRSGIAIGIFIALLFVVSHIDALSEQAQVLSRIRTVLVVLLVVFLGVTHARDVMGLFGNISDALPNPVASIQEKSAEQGKKAAEAYKSMDRVLNQQTQGEEARLRETERTVDDPERGK
jgi:glycosyltransferase involved in cell wall biosynthesis